MSKPPRKNTEPQDPGIEIYRDVVRYAEMGDHRTGSKADLDTSAWIAAEMAATGFKTTVLPWSLRQFLIEDCRIRLYGQTYEAFPLWYPKAIGSEPLSSDLILVEELSACTAARGKIALIRFPGLMVTDKSTHVEWINGLAEAGALAIIGMAPHVSGETYGQNVFPPFNQSAWPIPVLCIAPRDWHVFAQAAYHGDKVEATLNGRDDSGAKAESVIGIGRRSEDWIILSTPQSGWFRSAGERGTGLALLLALIRWLGRLPDGPSVLAMSNPGHEIGHIGIHHIFDHVDLPAPDQTRFWLHLGASIATRAWVEDDGVLRPNGPEPESWLFCSEDLIDPLRRCFSNVAHIGPEVYNRDHGEIRWILERGYPAFALMGPHRSFHLASDGPEVTTPSLLAETFAALVRTIGRLGDDQTERMDP